MAVTQEREEMRVAMQLKHDGWVAHIFDDKRISELKEMSDWCRQSFGPMYSQLYPNAWAGKWYGAQLPFQSGSIDTKRHVVFMFRDDKLYSMFKIMFSEK
jgi:hypothetical protein